MYDANGEESYEVEMSLTQNGDNYLLTLTADETWINSSERTFPVVIDPTLNFSINDVFVIDGVFDDTTRTGIELRVGRNLTNLARTYIKPTLPTNIPTGAVIENAELVLHCDYYYESSSAGDTVIFAYDCRHVEAWSPDTITWNNQPFDNSDNGYLNDTPTAVSYAFAFPSRDIYTFNLTTVAQRWIRTGIAEGIMLASSDETEKVQVDFHSSRALLSSNRPAFEYTYSLPSISMSEWNLTTPSAATSSPIKITTSEAWTITVDEPWISVSQTSGTGSSEFTISVTENTSANQREGTVTVWMGTVKIGEIKVYQSGSGTYLFLDEDTFFIDYKTCLKTVTVETNDETWELVLEIWNGNSFVPVEIDANNADEDAWLKVLKGTDKIELSVCKENTTANTNKARITVTAQSETNTVTKTIQIIQYDKVTCFFNTINEDGTLNAISSKEYNHALATWAMELSYAAYNPVKYEAIQGIPSSFMHAPYDVETRTAEFELESVGLTATPYNYDGEYWGYAAHTIGHRDIVIGNKQEKGEDNNDSSINLTTVHSTSGMVDANISGAQTDSGKFLRNAIQSGEIVSEIDESASRTSDNGRTLIVVSIRGSVTPLDWAMDLASQFDIEGKNFEAGCREIMESLEAYKISYKNEINNPIILVTGHSLGAAIANLVANELNAGISSDDVYAYTFATPNTVNLAGGKQAILYENVFNILNNNDAVPHFPVDQFGTEWARHGRDFHFTMPLVTQGIELFDIDLLGAFGHGMPNYYSWLNNLPDTLGKPAEDITVSDLEERSVDFAVGLGALLFKILCPVSVTLYDTDGNIVAFESQQEGAVYPEITDSGIVSWIAEDGGKMFLIPYGTEDIEARIEAYDYGTMTLTVEQPGVGEPLDTITYNNVNLYPDKEFKVEIAECFDSDEVALMQVETDENGNEIETEITELDSYLKSVTVDDPEVTYGTTSTFTVVTDKDAVKIQFIYHDSGSTMTLTRDHSLVTSLVEDGDNLIWIVQKVFTRGNHIFDFGVKMGSTWYVTENVIALTVK